MFHSTVLLTTLHWTIFCHAPVLLLSELKWLTESDACDFAEMHYCLGAAGGGLGGYLQC